MYIYTHNMYVYMNMSIDIIWSVGMYNREI